MGGFKNSSVTRLLPNLKTLGELFVLAVCDLHELNLYAVLCGKDYWFHRQTEWDGKFKTLMYRIEFKTGGEWAFKSSGRLFSNISWFIRTSPGPIMHLITDQTTGLATRNYLINDQYFPRRVSFQSDQVDIGWVLCWRCGTTSDHDVIATPYMDRPRRTHHLRDGLSVNFSPVSLPSAGALAGRSCCRSRQGRLVGGRQRKCSIKLVRVDTMHFLVPPYPICTFLRISILQLLS